MGFNGIFTLWLRELIRYSRSRSRIIGSLGMPFFFMLVIGFGLNPIIQIEGASYFSFLVPGIIGMILLFQSIFTGLTVVEDKQFGFMKEILVAPISRTSIVIGRALGGATVTVIQATLVLVIAILLGFSFQLSVINLILAFLLMFLVSFGFVCLGLAFASRMTDPHGFQLLVNFIIFPIFLLSGAFFPLGSIPEWLRFVAFIDPLTYAVDGLRNLLIGISFFSIITSLIALLLFAIITVLLASYLFNKME